MQACPMLGSRYRAIGHLSYAQQDTQNPAELHSKLMCGSMADFMSYYQLIFSFKWPQEASG